MNIKLGIVMDPINLINIKKDSSFTILLAAKKRKYVIYYMETKDLYMKNNQAYANARIVNVYNKEIQHFKIIKEEKILLSNLNVLLMRKDPPINMEFIYVTYILEKAEESGLLIINNPKSLRDCNEKLYTNSFPSITPKTLITSKIEKIYKFLVKNKDIILKPLNSMGGDSIFRLTINDPNISVILETMTKKNNHFCLIQKYIPEIKYGDKRILMINGKAIPLCLARIPKIGETRGNLAAGGIGKVQPLNENDWNIVNILSPFLKKRGLIIVGLDIIGNKLTEINITSPTGLCEIQKKYDKPITDLIFKYIEEKIFS